MKVFLILLLLYSIGCMSVASLSTNKRIYGGVIENVNIIVGDHVSGGVDAWSSIGITLKFLHLIDLPFSAIVDTAVLPYTLFYNLSDSSE